MAGTPKFFVAWDVVRDVRYAVRRLRNAPGFAVATVATLALGIGANTAVFSVANAILIRPLNVPDEERLVRVTTTYGGITRGSATLPHFNVLREQTELFDKIAAHRLDFLNFSGEGEPEQVPVARVTASFFQVFDAPVLYGRSFTSDEDRPRGDRVVVLSHGIWIRRFGGDPSVLGRAVVLGVQQYVVVGVLAPFDPEQFDERPDFWIPFQIDQKPWTLEASSVSSRVDCIAR